MIENDGPVSLPHICGKLYKSITFNALFQCVEDNNLLNPHQFGFRSGNSCFYQLLAIACDIYKAFDVNPSPEVRYFLRYVKSI